MGTKRKFKNDAIESIHASASALLEVGAIDKTTMRRFDESCLAKLPEMSPDRIRQIREKNHVSQPVFARLLNISESTVQKWEGGAFECKIADALLIMIRGQQLSRPLRQAGRFDMLNQQQGTVPPSMTRPVCRITSRTSRTRPPPQPWRADSRYWRRPRCSYPRPG